MYLSLEPVIFSMNLTCSQEAKWPNGKLLQYPHISRLGDKKDLLRGKAKKVKDPNHGNKAYILWKFGEIVTPGVLLRK